MGSRLAVCAGALTVKVAALSDADGRHLSGQPCPGEEEAEKEQAMNDVKRLATEFESVRHPIELALWPTRALHTATRRAK